MRRMIIAMLGAALLAVTSFAQAQVAGNSCTGLGCRAQDGTTGGGSCAGHYCVGGGGGTGGGDCVGNFCQSGNGGTAGADCIGDNCKAGNGRTGGGSCYGKGCQAGNGGTMGGSCFGEGCKPGNRGQAFPAPPLSPCCLAWAVAGRDLEQINIDMLFPRDRDRPLKPEDRYPLSMKICAERLKRSPNVNACAARLARGGYRNFAPIPETRPAQMPAPPTPLEQLVRRDPPDPRCQFDCQSWNPASNSCVGARMNGCRR